MLQAASSAESTPASGATAASNTQPVMRAMTTDQVEMDTSAPATLNARATQPVTEDFLLRSLKLNTEHILKSFTSHVNMLSQRVDNNDVLIAENAAGITCQAAIAAEHRAELAALIIRVTNLERSGQLGPQEGRPDYLLAWRSIRLWPVEGDGDKEMWEAVRNFIHDTLRVKDSEVSQDDIASVKRTPDRSSTGVNREVLVTFCDSRKRDLVISHSVNLADMVDTEARPTAGVRLEIPTELMDTFRMLSRSGTRLRARHGRGTKRHIKFDDFQGQLFTNIKFPGDESWTKITPEMARDNLDASMKEESA